MEEDNQEISGWNEDQFNFLDNKSLIKNKKKQTQIIQAQPNIKRKLKPSYTLPTIKNLRQSLIKQNNDNKETKQVSNFDNLIQKIQKQINKVQRISQIEDHIKQNSKNLLKEEIDVSKFTCNQTRTEESSLQLRKLFNQKHSNTVKRQQGISSIRKLKIQANQYCSTPKNMCNENIERNKQFLLKLKQNFSKQFSKNSKSKYFIVKKQKISPEKVSQEISKIAIQSRRSYQEIESPNQNQKHKYIKQKYKNLLKNFQVERKNSCRVFNSKSQQLKKNSKEKKKNQTELSKFKKQSRNSNNLTADRINQRDQNVLNSKRYIKNVDALQSDEYPKIKRAKKLSQILKQSQQFSKGLMKNKQKSLKMLRFSDKVEQNQFMGKISIKRSQNLSQILANRHKNVNYEKSLKMNEIKYQESKKKQVKRAENKKNRIKISTQPPVLDQFNDELIFVHK